MYTTNYPWSLASILAYTYLLKAKHGMILMSVRRGTSLLLIRVDERTSRDGQQGVKYDVVSFETEGGAHNLMVAGSSLALVPVLGKMFFRLHELFNLL